MSNFDGWWNKHHFSISGDPYYPLYKTLKNEEDWEYLDFLRFFVFDLSFPRKRRSKLPNREKLIRDVKNAIRCFDKFLDIMDSPHLKLWAKANAKILWDLLRGLEPVSGQVTTLKEIFGDLKPVQRGENWPESLAIIGGILRILRRRNELKANAFDKAMLEVTDYLVATNHKKGRPMSKAKRLLCIALADLLRKKAGGPCFPIVCKFLSAHFGEKISAGYVRQIQASHQEKKTIDRLWWLFKNRRQWRHLLES